ncbi:unnamed protein product [Phytophthora lilii]|uniref:Unnamed protein product n=1 Tax=Phytophthora lilii TaxID=2077276 RepID=A0A9W6THI6_9STRA|nr:unnamed protein product [Phytophthora lilii]
MAFDSPSCTATLDSEVEVELDAAVTNAQLVCAPPTRPKSKARHYERQKSVKKALTRQIGQLSELLQHEQAKEKRGSN